MDKGLMEWKILLPLNKVEVVITDNTSIIAIIMVQTFIISGLWSASEEEEEEVADKIINFEERQSDHEITFTMLFFCQFLSPYILILIK